MAEFNRWISFSLRYLGKPPWDTQTSPPELIEFIAQHRVGRALDLGCGTGTNLVTLAQAGWEVCGVDFIWLAVLKAKNRLKKVGVIRIATSKPCVVTRCVIQRSSVCASVPSV